MCTLIYSFTVSLITCMAVNGIMHILPHIEPMQGGMLVGISLLSATWITAYVANEKEPH